MKCKLILRWSVELMLVVAFDNFQFALAAENIQSADVGRSTHTLRLATNLS